MIAGRVWASPRRRRRRKQRPLPKIAASPSSVVYLHYFCAKIVSLCNLSLSVTNDTITANAVFRQSVHPQIT